MGRSKRNRQARRAPSWDAKANGGETRQEFSVREREKESFRDVTPVLPLPRRKKGRKRWGIRTRVYPPSDWRWALFRCCPVEFYRWYDTKQQRDQALERLRQKNRRVVADPATNVYRLSRYQYEPVTR